MASTISYKSIGYVESFTNELLRPEIIRAAESRIVLESRFIQAVARLKVGQHLWVIYHLHQAEYWQDRFIPELFIHRIASRPNPIGITLVRVVALEDSIITVVGLDAINGSPIIDIKPYKPIFDGPPVTA